MALDEGEDHIIAETLDDFALKVATPIDDFERPNAPQNRAIAKCQGRFEWRVRGAQLLDALTGIASDPSSAGASAGSNGLALTKVAAAA